MPWGSIRGHDAVVEGLRRGLAEGRFPHAFLLVGPEGVGKRTFAMRMAKALLCERRSESAFDPCDACPSCLQVGAGTHPDVLSAKKPEEKHELPIAVIRDLCHDLSLKPMHGRRRVAVIDDADDLSEEAANAFLKSLEEPPEGSVLALVATSVETQLDTVVSRCRVVRFEPLGVADLEAVLREQGLAERPEDVSRLAQAAEGSVGRAKGLADPEFGRFRRQMIDEIGSTQGFQPPALSRRMDAFLREAGKESAAHRERAALLIGELMRLFRSVLWQTAGLEAPAADPLDRRAIAHLGDRLEPEEVFVLADRCLEADYHVRRKAHLALTFDAFLVDLGRVINRQRG